MVQELRRAANPGLSTSYERRLHKSCTEASSGQTSCNHYSLPIHWQPDDSGWGAAVDDNASSGQLEASPIPFP